MSDDRRNPYVILGVPFGATEKEARAGFARVTRRLRGDPNALYQQEDLTWALHQIEQIIADPELALHVYRLPANPQVVAEADGAGVFKPPPEKLSRRTDALSPEDLVDLRTEVLRRRLRAEIATRGLHHTVPYADWG